MLVSYVIYIMFQQFIIKFSLKYLITEFFIISVTYDFWILFQEVKSHNSYGNFVKIRESCFKYARVLKTSQAIS